MDIYRVRRSWRVFCEPLLAVQDATVVFAIVAAIGGVASAFVLPTPWNAFAVALVVGAAGVRGIYVQIGRVEAAGEYDNTIRTLGILRDDFSKQSEALHLPIAAGIEHGRRDIDGDDPDEEAKQYADEELYGALDIALLGKFTEDYVGQNELMGEAYRQRWKHVWEHASTDGYGQAMIKASRDGTALLVQFIHELEGERRSI
jgi:hypothetical protein